VLRVIDTAVVGELTGKCANLCGVSHVAMVFFIKGVE
jgi:heme/copper-type cytochrome/quinol oxidase subunit 2